jgi:hypothetical protein
MCYRRSGYQAPEHYDCNDVGEVLRPVQHRAGPLVELLAAYAAAEPAVALRGAFGSLGDGR